MLVNLLYCMRGLWFTKDRQHLVWRWEFEQITCVLSQLIWSDVCFHFCFFLVVTLLCLRWCFVSDSSAFCLLRLIVLAYTWKILNKLCELIKVNLVTYLAGPNYPGEAGSKAFLCGYARLRRTWKWKWRKYSLYVIIVLVW